MIGQYLSVETFEKRRSKKTNEPIFLSKTRHLATDFFRSGSEDARPVSPITKRRPGYSKNNVALTRCAHIDTLCVVVFTRRKPSGPLPFFPIRIFSGSGKFIQRVIRGDCGGLGAGSKREEGE